MDAYVHDHQLYFSDSPFKKSSVQLPFPLLNRTRLWRRCCDPQGPLALPLRIKGRIDSLLYLGYFFLILTATLLLKTTGNKYHILKSLKKMPRSGEPTWSLSRTKALSMQLDCKALFWFSAEGNLTWSTIPSSH